VLADTADGAALHPDAARRILRGLADLANPDEYAAAVRELLAIPTQKRN
jgi:hypothetical protein